MFDLYPQYPPTQVTRREPFIQPWMTSDRGFMMSIVDDCVYAMDEDGQFAPGSEFFTCEIWFADDDTWHVEIMHPTRGDEPMDDELETSDLGDAMLEAAKRFDAWIKEWRESVDLNNQAWIAVCRRWHDDDE